MDGGLNVDGAAVPSDTEETGDSAGLPGDGRTGSWRFGGFAG